MRSVSSSGVLLTDEPSLVTALAESVSLVPEGQRRPGKLHHFQRAAHAHVVVRRKPLRRDRVHFFETFVERFTALRFDERAVTIAHRRIRRRRRGQSEQQRSDPEKRAPADDGRLRSGRDLGDALVRKLGEARGVHGFEGVDGVDQVMADPSALVGSGLAGADVEVTVDLDAVGAHDFPARTLGQGDGQRRLSGRRRSHHDGEFRRFFSGLRRCQGLTRNPGRV